MFSFMKRYSKTIIDIGILIGLIFFIMWTGKLIFNVATPLVFSYFIYLFIEPFNRFFINKGVKRSISTVLSFTILLLIVLGIVTILSVVFISQFEVLIDNVNSLSSNFEEYATKSITIIEEQLNKLPPEVIEKMKTTISSISTNLLKFSTKLLGGILGSITSISVMSIKFIIGIILAFFLSLESEQLSKFVSNNSPSIIKDVYYFLKNKVFSHLGGYLKAQLKLIFFTFIIIFITLLILGIDNAFTIAVICAIADILPLIGVTAIFIPWILYTFLIKGSIVLGIELVILLLVVILFRQIAEPKIAGDSLGVSAFFMLASMTVFMSIFGVAGVILTPILIILIKELYENGYLSKWIRKPEEVTEENEELN